MQKSDFKTGKLLRNITKRRLKMKTSEWQKDYKAKVEAMPSLDLLSKISNINSWMKGTSSGRWEFDCAKAEMQKRLNTINYIEKY